VVSDADAPDAAPPAPPALDADAPGPSLFGYGVGDPVPPVTASSSATSCNISFNASGFNLARPFPLLGLTGDLSLPLSLFPIVFELFSNKKIGRRQFKIRMGQLLIYTETVGGILKNVGNCVQPGRPREQAATAIYQSVSRYITRKRRISRGISRKDLQCIT
jgi:hypothetical protein